MVFAKPVTFNDLIGNMILEAGTQVYTYVGNNLLHHNTLTTSISQISFVDFNVLAKNWHLVF